MIVFVFIFSMIYENFKAFEGILTFLFLNHLKSMKSLKKHTYHTPIIYNI